jgi:signal transduction histidine kinase
VQQVAFEEVDSPVGRNWGRLLGHLTEGVALCRDGVISWANPRLAAIVGRNTSDALIGEAFEALLEDAGAGLPSAGAIECRVRGARGERPRVRIRRADCSDGESELWVVEDVSAERRLEQEVFDLSQSLHAANRELAELREQRQRDHADREELLQVVSHELRTPVTVINGYHRLLLSEEVGALNDEQRRYLRETTKSCHRLNAFIGNLLEGARPAPRDRDLDLRNASLEPTLSGVVSFLRPMLDERRLRVEMAIDHDALWARFDGPRIEQVLTNLLGNATRYATGGGTIEVSTAPIEAAGLRFVEVSVADDGPGVPLKDRERIFEPYVRGSQRSGGGGLGLGLAICKRIVDAHGGSIAVTDRRGAGCRFAFTLPAVDPEEKREGER